MRCNECGYTNADNAHVCGKCQAPLSSGGGSAYNPPPSPSFQGGGGSGKSTVKGANANMPYWDDNSGGNAQNTPVQDNDSSTKSYKNCPSCGYVLMPDAAECPNCDWKMPNAAKQEAKKDAPIAPPPPIIQRQAEGGHSGKSTMKLGSFNPMDTAKKFSLTDNNSQQKVIFEGNNVEVNRTNLDAQNSAISSKVHARFVHENGVWYVNDESSNQATFVQVKGKVALENGTVLIVGNKILTFESE